MSKAWPTLAAAAAVVLVVGLAIALRPGTDATTQLDVANPEIVEPTVPVPTTVQVLPTVVTDQATTELPENGGLIDYTQSPTLVELPAGSRVVAGAPTQDLTIIDLAVFGSAANSCGDLYGLLPSTSSGHVLVDQLVGSGTEHSFVATANGDIGVVTEKCGGEPAAIQIGEPAIAQIGESGTFDYWSQLHVPEGQQLQKYAPVWTHDDAQVMLHAVDESGATSLLTYDRPVAGTLQRQLATSVMAFSDLQPKRVLAELSGGIRVEASQGQLLIDGQPVGSYPPELSLHVLTAERSSDTNMVAIAAVGTLTILDAGGEVATFGGTAPILAMDWTSAGQLVFSAEQSLLVYNSQAADGQAFSEVSGVDEGLWFEVEVSDSGTVIALSGELDGERVARYLRFPGDHRVPAFDPAERLIRLDPPTMPVGEQALSLRGIGAIQTGMTVAEAQDAVGGTLVYTGGYDGCGYAVLAGDPQSPAFLVITYVEDGPDLPFLQGTIERIDVGPSHTTLSGIGVGSTEDAIRAAYGDRIEVTPHKYLFAEGGEYFTFVPVDAADSDYRLVMETFDDQVVAMHSGRVPAVLYIEGCA